MTTKEHKEYLREFKKQSENIVSTKKSAIKFLKEAGILTRNGELSEKYKEKNTLPIIEKRKCIQNAQIL